MIRQRLLTGTLSNVGGKLTAVGVWFFLTPFVLARLGPHGYALWVLMGAVASYGFLLDFGIGGAVVKYVAEHVARGERDAARAMVASAVRLYAGLAIVVVGLAFLIAPAFPALMRMGEADHRTATWLVILTGVNVALTIAFTPSLAVLRGLQRYDLFNAVVVFGSVLEGVAAAGALVAGWGVLGMVGSLIPVTAVAGLVGVYAVKRTAPDLAVAWRGGSVASMRLIASFSSSLFAIQLAGRLQTKTDEFVIALFRPLSAVTPYALARKLGELAQMAAVQFFKVVMPLASELDAGAQVLKLRNLYIVASRIALAIAVPVAVVIGVLGGVILSHWVGPEYSQYGTLVAILAMASLVDTSQWPAVEILQGMARHRIVASTSIAAGVANIVISILLLPALGLIGVALGTLIPAVAASLCVVMPFANRKLHVSWQTALREMWMPAIVPGAVAASVLMVLHQHWPSPSLPTMIGWIAATGLIYGTGYLTMPATEAERQLLSDLVIGGSRRLRQFAVSRIAS